MFQRPCRQAPTPAPRPSCFADMSGSEYEDSAECPLCCAELDLTDRSIQYCDCGCACPSWRGLARADSQGRPSPAAGLPTVPPPTWRPRPPTQTKCACGATTTSWKRPARRTWPPAAQTAAAYTTRTRSRCSTSTQKSGSGPRERVRGWGHTLGCGIIHVPCHMAGHAPRSRAYAQQGQPLCRGGEG